MLVSQPGLHLQPGSVDVIRAADDWAMARAEDGKAGR